MLSALLKHQLIFLSFPLSNLKVQFEVLARAVIFCDVPGQFKSLVYAFYSHAFQAYQSGNKKDSEQMDTSGMPCSLCDQCYQRKQETFFYNY